MTRSCIIVLLFLAAFSARSAAAVSCTASASSLVFGDYAGGMIDVTNTITVFCTAGTVFHLSLNAGNTPGATVTTRSMFGGNGGQNTLGYQLFSDAAYTVNWGNTAGTNWVTSTGTGAQQNFTVYARIPANEVSPLGSYTDTITASLSGSTFSTTIASFSVTSTVIPGCTISASNLNFGNYSGSLINSNSTITVNCPSGTTYNVGLNAGTATGATVTTRKMTGPSGTLLAYKLFRNSTHTLNWGNTVGTDTQAGTGSGAAQALTVYGQLPAGSPPRSGAYSDTITATVTF
ncbi:MAG TPA: spore coat U domain-containing protein [Terracidiphilus sp.]|nr:spore coat U domain-containing protein [Terracidiphilus sp.]